MANRYLVAGGTGNWNSTTNWSATDGGASGASFPTAADAVFCTAASGAATITTNVAGAALSIDFSGFTSTITLTNQLTVAGSVTLSTGMTIAGSGNLLVQAASTLTSNGKTWTGNLTIASGVTHALADAWVVTGLLTLGNSATTTTINSANPAHTLTCQGGLTTGNGSTIAGTTKLRIVGTQTIGYGGATAGSIRLDLEFVSGTITISSAQIFRYQTGTMLYTGGTIVTTGTTLYIGASTTFDCSAIVWNHIQLAGVSTLTLTSDLICGGLFTLGSGASGATINGARLEARAGVTIGTSATIAGTATLVLAGTGTFTKTINTTWTLNTEIDAPGATITFSGSCLFPLGLLLVTDVSTIITDDGTWLAFGGGSSSVRFHPGMGGGMSG